jgi:hypothetical protein
MPPSIMMHVVTPSPGERVGTVMLAPAIPDGSTTTEPPPMAETDRSNGSRVVSGVPEL